MEYERIHKVQMGVMSPTKLRMKLLGMGSHGDGGGGKDDKSPSRLDAGASGGGEDEDHPKSSLLPQELDGDSSEYPKDRSDSSRSRSDASRGRSAGYISNGNGGGFEFQTEERAGLGPFFFRQVPSKWNDAEKWIVGRHVVHSDPIFSKKAVVAVAHWRRQSLRHSHRRTRGGRAR